MQHEHAHTAANSVELPRPTAWPLVLALGVTLILFSMVTSIVFFYLGLLLSGAGIVGWFLQLFPVEAHEAVPVIEEEIEITTTRKLVQREPRAVSEAPRTILPVETFRITNGLRGGIAGGIAMILPATLFSLLKYHSVWYAMNLLAAGGFVSWAGASDAFLSQFHIEGLLAALAIHGCVSVLVGLLYGAMLPMFPRYPIVTAGFMVPFIFTAILHSAIGIISPILNERIDWFWFVVSQVAFGLVCGYVVNLQVRVRTPQFRALPFAIRAGIQATGIEHPEAEHPDAKDEQK
jgi:hypothetical protein